jgi:hypothetical protein
MARSPEFKRAWKRALEKAWELRWRMRRGGRFEQEAFRAALPAELQNLGSVLTNVLVYDKIADDIDRASRTTATGEMPSDEEETAPAERQPSLFPEFDLAGEYHLGGGGRVAKDMADLQMYQQHLENVSRNRSAVNQAADREQTEFLKLLPYLTIAGTNKKQAILAYRHDHPPAEPDIEIDPDAE